MMAGNYTLAYESFSGLADHVPSNVFIYRDLLVASAYAGEPRTVVTVFEAAPQSYRSDYKTDLVAIAYLELASQSASNSDCKTARTLWKIAQGFHSGDLFVQYLSSRGVGLCLIDDQALEEHDKAITIPSEHVQWYGNEVWNSAQTEYVLSLIDEQQWTPGAILGIALNWASTGHVNSAVYILQQATQRVWATPEIYVLLADFYFNKGDLKEALAVSHRAISYYPEDAWLSYNLGRIQEVLASRSLDKQVLILEALKSYRRSFQLKQDEPFALHKLVQLNSQIGNLDESGKWRIELLRLLIDKGPEYKLEKRVSPGLALHGYSIQDKAISLGLRIPVALWWSSTGDTRWNETDSYQLPGTDQGVQFYDTPNLVPNGGFEQDGGTGTMLPSGYQEYFSAPIDSYELRYDSTGERTGRILHLVGSAIYTTTAVTSSVIEVDATKIYLQAAWIRSPDGNPHLGYRWLPNGHYDYVAQRSSDMWTHWSGLAVPPKDTRTANIWLMRYENVGSVDFDDVVFIEVKLPSQLQDVRRTR